jgi:hypothetical protein
LLAFGTLVLLYQELERRQVLDLGEIISSVKKFLKEVHLLIWSDHTRLVIMFAYGVILIGLTQWNWLKLHEIYDYEYERNEVFRYIVLTPIGGFIFVYIWNIINASLDLIAPIQNYHRYWILDLPSWLIFVLFIGVNVVVEKPMKGVPELLLMFSIFLIVRIICNPRYNLLIAKRLILVLKTYV